MAGDAVACKALLCRGHGLHCRLLFIARRLPRFVTSDTVIHRQHFERPCRWPSKSLHRSMTSLALYLRRHDMDTMREKNVRRQSPNSPPRNFLALLTEGQKLLYLRTLALAPRVAGHAQRGGRSAGDVIILRPLMATRARELQRDMSLVGELNGLFHARQPPTHPKTRSQNRADNHDKDGDFCRCASLSHPNPTS